MDESKRKYWMTWWRLSSIKLVVKKDNLRESNWKKDQTKKNPIPTDVSTRRHVKQYYVANPLDLPWFHHLLGLARELYIYSNAIDCTNS